MEAKSADDFVVDQIDLEPDGVRDAVQQIADSRGNPPTTYGQVLEMLERDGLAKSSRALR